MYKITNITDLDYNTKVERLLELKLLHGEELRGEILDFKYLISIVEMDMRNHLYFLWFDSSDKMLRTSLVSKIDKSGNIFKVTTENSIYYFEEETD